jgi:hypothetical protein
VPEWLLCCPAAVLQDIWWDDLAACSGTLLQMTSASGSAWSQHPCALRLAANSSPANACAHLQSKTLEAVEDITENAVHVLLLAEVWDLLPWQLQQLEAACAGDGSKGGSSSSSSSSSSSGQLARTPSSWWADETFLDAPLLPIHRGTAGSSGTGNSSPLPAVTLQQLQLVTCAMGQGYAAGMHSASLLLTLLLQRADPGLRVEYLGGPWGSLMMHTLAEATQREQLHGASCGLVEPLLPCNEEEALDDFKRFVQGLWQVADTAVEFAAASSLVVLAWTHLEVQQQQQEEEEEEGAGGDKEPLDCHGYVLTTVQGAYKPDVHPLGEKGCSQQQGHTCCRHRGTFLCNHMLLLLHDQGTVCATLLRLGMLHTEHGILCDECFMCCRTSKTNGCAYLPFPLLSSASLCLCCGCHPSTLSGASTASHFNDNS